jgi:hypothetical protein
MIIYNKRELLAMHGWPLFQGSQSISRLDTDSFEDYFLWAKVKSKCANISLIMFQ